MLTPSAGTDLLLGNLTVSVAHPKLSGVGSLGIVASTSIHHSELPINYTVTSGSESCVVTVQAVYNSPPPSGSRTNRTNGFAGEFTSSKYGLLFGRP